MNCTLKAVAKSFPPIPLANGKAILVGRGPFTLIKDPRCSRNQVEITAIYKTKTVKVKQIGPNDSGLNGTVIGVGLEVTANNGDRIEVLQGEYKYTVCWEDELETYNSKPAKIPKMFLPKSTDNFKKDSTLTKGSWESLAGGKLLAYSNGEDILAPKPQVTAFDMDGTIITTKSGRVFPKDDLDWKFLFPTTQVKLQSYFAEKSDTKFLILTNQAGISKGSQDASGLKKKIENITRQLATPVVVLVATGKSEYRKPMTGSWNVYVKNFNAGVIPDLNTSLFCGDAAGRIGKKKDHATSDRLFAMNLGIVFQTPEQFFLGQKTQQEFQMPLFNPQTFVQSFNDDTALSNSHIMFPHHQEMVLMVGYPASGKSTFAKTVLVAKSYVHVNQDTLKTPAKCMSTAENALRNSESVVVDNTNADRKARAEYIKLAKKHGVPVRCFKMNVDHSQALHNNKYRELSQDAHAAIPHVAFNSFKARFHDPSVEEGFTEVLTVNFVPNFKDEESKELYAKFLLEK